MFSKEDRDQILKKGITTDTIQYQLEKFNTGFSFTEIIKAATTGDGVLSLSERETDEIADLYDRLSKQLEITRFVPASGAATRMFKSLFTIQEKFKEISPEQQLSIIQQDSELMLFFEQISRYPFHADLKLRGNESPKDILDRLLNDSGLSYGKLPKGLLKFHSYSSGSRTAFEEHLREAAGYCNRNGIVNMHFTISPEHHESFSDLEAQILPVLEVELGVHFKISYSYQKDETDTIAVDTDNNPFRDSSGRLVFRPGGHGALLENLDEIKADILFITNIDNVAPDRLKDSRILCKKFLGGVLLKAREEIYSYLQTLGGDETPGDSFYKDMFDWMGRVLSIDVTDQVLNGSAETKRLWAISQLDRPLRVCGMVINEGEPGGGPFFVRDRDGNVSLQIVEPSQIDVSNSEQKEILQNSTHFNPVDLVCSLRKPSGEKYNLMNYRDPETGFITMKSMLGKDLKAQELPGLWNGSMAYWNTIFVEVPGYTFTPVKTVFDLTRPEHQAKG